MKVTSSTPSIGGSRGGFHIHIKGSGFGHVINLVSLKLISSSSSISHVRKRRTSDSVDEGGIEMTVVSVNMTDIVALAPAMASIGQYDIMVSIKTIHGGEY